MDILKLVRFDKEATEAEQQAANERAKKARWQALGQAVESGKPLDEASALAQRAEEREQANIYNWYTVNPNELYPAMIDFIQTQIAEGKQGDGVIRSQYYPEAAALPQEAWSLALTPRDEVTKKRDIEVRYDALEVARRWFTELLHRSLRWQSIGMKEPKFWHTEPPAESAFPLALYIEKDERWRL